ncbi:HNH endonuclease [Nocardia farcinica]|uniref:HNH endonuclease n=1 Tax=Nocardia farcinica TaxID=37329 RepID=UPI001892E717|nr:HNH endonuclease signature motif containing protein [Nocardia farcinica]MBF6374499.1 HNH endonuclease [Nocardia farcinica]
MSTWPKSRPRAPRRRYTGATPAVLMLVKSRAGGRCERCAAPIPTTAEVHHRIPRGMGGTRDPRVNRPSALVVLCPQCHRRIESYREKARLDGWLVRRTSNPTEVAIESRLHGRVLLADDGSVVSVGGDAA